MQREDLREKLEELHAELERTEAVDAEARSLLQEVVDEIRGVLERSGDDASEHDSLGDRLRDLASHFERSHPTLTAAVGRVADALSNLGI